MSSDFLTQISLKFTDNAVRKRRYPVSSSFLGENVWLMSEVRGEQAEKLIGRQQLLN